ncbi:MULTISPECIES: hypothetical protein [unclassified Streptomyces]|uniref:hypothetical protein n=1 Tax=unclassified Streptomyces TaxID=2593676 RepID=UPI00403CBC72
MPTTPGAPDLLVREVSGLDPQEACRANSAYRRLREAILDGDIPPGATIDSADLANGYKLDGEIVRAVFKGLIRNGLATDQGRSLQVTTPADPHPAQQHPSATPTRTYQKRASIYHSAFGESKTLSQWAQDPRCHVTYQQLHVRINVHEWDIERALTTCPRPRQTRVSPNAQRRSP